MRTVWHRIAQVSTLMPLTALWCDPAGAYRPFDGTDAAVADLHNLEIEHGPVEYSREGGERTLLAPNIRLNYGFAKGWEAVLEGETTHGLSATPRPTSQVENGFFLKTVLREGVLQDQPGPSIATEFGVLLPGINDQHGVGGSVAGILSQRWEPITVHFNAAAAVTREHHADLFFSTILEGPHDWTFRPVAELAYQHDFGGAQIKSALVGAIWQARDNLAVDLGLRGGCADHHTLAEIRAGLTLSFAIGAAPARKSEGGGR